MSSLVQIAADPHRAAPLVKDRVQEVDEGGLAAARPSGDEHHHRLLLGDSVLKLLARGPLLPPPAERKRLREAAGLTQQDVATALQKKRETVNGWETGRTTPRPPRLAAYQHLLNGWAERYPATDDAGVRRPKGGDAPDASLPRDE